MTDGRRALGALVPAARGSLLALEHLNGRAVWAWRVCGARA